jgi:hypothetical protein
MRSPEEQKVKVVSLLDKRKQADAAEAGTTTPEEELTFEEIMRRNQANLDRMRRERLNANKSVLRSYRIKN